MGSVNSAREPTSKQPDEISLAAFLDVGQILAEARKEQNFTIEQVAAKIYIRQRYLQDLEEGDLSDLPGRVYILGFIRTYARLLNLDGEELIRRISTLPNLPDYERSQVPMAKPSEEEPNFLILIGSGVLILLIAIGGYVFLKPSSDVSSSMIEATSIDNSQTQLQLPPPPTQDQVQDTVLEPSSQKDEEETRLLELPQPPSLQVLPQLLELNATSPVANPTQSDNEGENLKGVASSPKRIVLKAKEPSWIEIRDEAGHVIFMKVLNRGEEYVTPEKPGVTLNTGNAGGIDIFVGETKLPSLGAHGEVKRGIRLETLQ